MKIKFFGLNILSAAALARVSGDVTKFISTEADQAVIALKSTDIGKIVAADIKAVKDHALSGAEKFEKVLSNTLPLVLKYATGGGLSAAVDDVEDIARSLVQSVYNDFASSSAGKVAKAILALFKKA